MAVERLETHHFMDQQDFFSASYPKEEEKEDAGDDRCSSDTQEVNKKKKKILVLGGTAFIGRTVVESLAAGGYSLVLLNRGRSYWDGKHVENAEYIQADRRDSTAFSKCIDTLTQKEVEEGRESWLAVVDFSAYKPTEMQASLDGLQGRFDMYIYISSDSVYEVCDSELWKDSPFVDESHAVRPADEARVRILRKKDTYGHGHMMIQIVSGRISCGLRCLDSILSLSLFLLSCRNDVATPHSSSSPGSFFLSSSLYVPLSSSSSIGALCIISTFEFYVFQGRRKDC